MSDGEIATYYRQALDRKAQIRILAELNDCSTDEIIAILHNRGIEAPKVKSYDPSEVKGYNVAGRRAKADAKRYRTGRWTEEESQTIVRLYEDGYTVDEIARKVRRTENAIKARIWYLRQNGEKIREVGRPARQRHKWTAEEDQIIMDMCRDGYRWAQMGEAIQRSACSVKGRVEALRKEGVQVEYRAKDRRNDPD